MKRRTINTTILLLFLLAPCCISCIGNLNMGPVEKETRKIGAFNEIEVSHGINLYLTTGKSNHLEVETAKSILSRLITEVKGDKLKIYFSGSFIMPTTANVYLEATSVSNITTSGGSDVIGENTLHTEDLKLTASGGSDIRLEVDTQYLEVNVSGGADIVLSGRAKYMEVKTSGGSDFKGFELIVQKAKLHASGGSDIRVYVEDDLEARASGGADIRYKGNPRTIDTKNSAGGDISRVN
jgi:hypothetical protein